LGAIIAGILFIGRGRPVVEGRSTDADVLASLPSGEESTLPFILGKDPVSGLYSYGCLGKFDESLLLSCCRFFVKLDCSILRMDGAICFFFFFFFFFLKKKK
jgi:hypothetical protein